MSRSSRHTAILIGVTLCGCLAAVGGWRFAKASAPVNGPIILLSVDTLRADHLGAYGYTRGRTPAIDALAADGVVFDRAYAHVPETLPAHASLLTGRLPIETGVRDAGGYTLLSATRTIAEMLRDRGYATGGIVSSYLLRKETGIGRGFTIFDDELPPADSAQPDAWLTRDGTASEQVAEHWLESAGTARAFLFLHIAEPQTTTPVPDRLAGLTPYDARVAAADEVVGRLVRYLKSHQLYDRSTIVLVSDHGEGLGEHGEQGHGLLVHEEDLHVPLIVKQPAGDGVRRHVPDVVQQIDIVPTLLDLAKAPGAGGLRGRSLTALLGGGTLAAAPVYAESMYGAYRFGWSPLTTVIDGPYQLISDGPSTTLYDLSVAPDARQDLAASKPDVVASLTKTLGTFNTKAAPQPAAPVTAADRDRLEALGYVGAPGTPASADAPESVGAHVAFVEAYRDAVRRSRTADAKDAVEALRALTLVQPGSVDVWMHLARTAARQERHDVALDAFHQALALDASNAAAHLGAAASSLRMRKLDEAAEQAHGVLDTAGADTIQTAEAHEVLARVALGHNDADTARSEAASAEAADADRPVKAFVEGRLALDSGRFDEAATAFQAALDAASKAGRAPLADLRVYAADALVRAKRQADAEALLTAELAAYPANGRARSALQALYRASGRKADAAALITH